MDKVKVFAPATVANVGCGVDIFGFALKNIGDIITVEKTNNKGEFFIDSIKGDDGILPYDISKNTATVSIKSFLEHLDLKIDFGIKVSIEKQMPLKSGMGSSASSSVGGVYAINELLDKPFSKKELIKFAAEGELEACGSGHADNISPSMLGGFCVVTSYNPITVEKIDFPDSFHILVIHPNIDIPTQASRKVIKDYISIKTHREQTGHISGLLIGLLTKNYNLLFENIKDYILEPKRSLLIPCYNEIKKILLSNNSLATNISGSGPSIFSFFKNINDLKKASDMIKNEYKKFEIKVDLFETKICKEGVSVLSK